MNAREPESTRTLEAIALVTIGFSLVPVMDAIAKYLSATYPVVQIAWARFVFHLSFVIPVVLWRHRGELWPKRPRLQLARGVFQLTATVLFFAAISRMPIANALALLFAYPLIVTALSPVLLGETVRPIQWLAIFMGFGGVLLILRPGMGSFPWAGVLALAAGASFALYIMATRRVAGSSPPLVTLVYSALVGAVLLSLGTPRFWIPPRPIDWAWMIAIGFFAASGHFLIVKGYELAPASRLAPFGYVEIIVATLLGYAVFSDVPDGLAFVGIAVIIVSGILVSYPTKAPEPT